MLQGETLERGSRLAAEVTSRKWVLAAVIVSALALGGANLPNVGPAEAAASGKAAKAKGETVSATSNVQVAQFAISLAAGSSATIQFGPTTQYDLQTWSQSAPKGGGRVTFLVAGMTANSTYHMRSLVTLADGTQQFGDDHTFATGGLPAEQLPQVSVVESGTGIPNPGIELLDLVPLVTAQNNLVHTVATDLSGNIIWYYNPPQRSYAYPIKLLPNGHMLVNLVPPTKSGFNGMREIDLSGKTINQLSVAAINSKLAAARTPWRVDVIHHDFLTLANGHLILLVNYNKAFKNLTGLPGRTVVTGDALIDLDQHRNIKWTWSSFKFLDVNRHPLSFPDWTHSNAVIYSPDDGNLIVSMRDQGWVIKIDYANGRGDGHIIWRLGNGGDFALIGGATPPTDWNYAQHYPTIITPNSTGVFQMGLMDNGNGRIFPDGGACGTTGEPACYSRALIFQLDETAMTAQIVWQDSPLPFSLCCGNTDVLGNGDVEFDLAFLTPAMVEEVQPQSPSTPVWQMNIPGQLPYRVLRIPSLYPGVQW